MSPRTRQTAQAPAGGFEDFVRGLVAVEVERLAAEFRPDLVHQRSVEDVVGAPRRDYLRIAREGGFPSTKEGRLVIARTVDVCAFFEARMRVPTPKNADSESKALSRVGLRRVSP